MIRVWPWLSLAVSTSILMGGCVAGPGVGAAAGSVYMLGCDTDRDIGTAVMPVKFDLKPAFFAGEPIEGLGMVGLKVNRLIIRLQTTGRRKEVNDVLAFDMPNVREVARCVRGRVDMSTGQGVPDYDLTNCFQGPDGPVLRVAPDALVRVFFSPNATCTKALTATAISTKRAQNDGAWESWIRFAEFGTAAAAGPPETRPPVPADFKVDFDQRLDAPAFKLELTDFTGQQTVPYGNIIPVASQIGGMMNGYFDFLLKRGQGAQTFP
jgi:hypothetical protein